MVLREVVLLLAIGVAIGVPAALAASRLASSLLFGLTPHDPATIAAAVAALSVVTVVSGYLPARRATKIDPMAALRYE
jgi:ABC-type antimicrobial peptide transport system permease subunit